MVKKLSALAAAAALTMLAAPVAQAHELELEGSPVCSLTDMPGADACAGAFDGNNTGVLRPLVLAELADLTGLGGWFQVAISNWSERAATGTLILPGLIDAPFAVALKAGTNFSLYYFNGVGPAVSSVSYTTLGTAVNRRGIPRELSHATLYLTHATPVPEPAPYGMLLAGLAGIGWVMRRRRG